jgi:RP/EB family microtubule-associated protein
MADSIGIMEGAFFVGKNEILNWINYTYKLNLVKIEQACTGAVYCQIIDSLHPKKVKMHKVNWRAKLEHEFIANFKILQQAFTECKISKNIEVEKLVKGKYQDNLEFLQWMKRYFDNKQISVDYDPLERRNNSELEICNEGNGLKSRNNSKPHTYPQNTNPFLSNKNSKVGIKSVEKSINIGKLFYNKK